MLMQYRVRCQLLESVSLDSVHSGPSNMHCCHEFLFALAWLSCDYWGYMNVLLLDSCCLSVCV